MQLEHILFAGCCVFFAAKDAVERTLVKTRKAFYMRNLCPRSFYRELLMELVMG